MTREPFVIRRGVVGQWASIIGGAGLLVGMLALISQRGLSPVAIAAFVIGALGIALWVLMTPGEFRSFLTGRQVRYSTTAIFSTLLLVGLVSMVYVYLQRQVITADMTEGGRFTLSEETFRVLEGVRHSTKDIQLTGFYTRQELQQRAVDDQFFRLYEVASDGHIKRAYVDPDTQPGIAERFAQRYGIVTGSYNVFLSYINPDGTIDFDSTIRVPRSANQERDMTEAISRLLVSGQFKVYFETSHGEYDPLDDSQQGISAIGNGVRESGLITAPLDLTSLAASGGSIPVDASAVILARPTTQFSAQEIAIIDAYMQSGGSLFIMSDALFSADSFMHQDDSFNQYLWDNFGLRALDAVAVDPGSSGQTALDIISSVVFTNNDIGQRLNVENDPDTRTQFRIARVIDVSDTPPVNNGRVIMTSPASFGETDLQAVAETSTYQYDEGADIPGPVTTVAWAWNQETEAKVLLVGDGDFVTNGQVTTSLGNAILFTDGLAWLTGFGAQVSFGVQAYRTGLPVLLVEGQTLDMIALVTVVLMPSSALLLGLLVWLRRVRR